MDHSADLYFLRPSSDPPPFRPSCLDQTADTMSLSFQSTRFPKGMNPRLYEAAESGNVGELKELLKNKVEVLGEVTPEGNTALHLAAYNGHSQFVKELLQLSKQDAEAGRNQFVTAKNREGNTALHEAAIKGKEEIVQDLLAQSPELARALNFSGETALFKAAQEGHRKIVARLVGDTPAEYDRRSSDGKTPLHLAVIYKHKGVIEELLQQRSELLQQIDHFDRTPLHLAAFIPEATPPPISEIFRWVRYKYHGRKYIRQSMGKMLLDRDKDESLCYRVDKNRQSPLHIAAKEGNSVLVEEILNRPNDCVQMVDKDGRNALHLAVQNAPIIFDWIGRDLTAIISNLASKRGINCSDKSGKTPLDIAIENTNEDPKLFRSLKRHLRRRYGGKRNVLGTETTSTGAQSAMAYQMISVIAALIATVAFAAAFTMPGNLVSDAKDSPAPALINEYLFKVFLIFDALAFYHSITSAALLVYALSGNKAADRILARRILRGMWAALVSLGITFGAAIHLVVVHKCLWLAVLVWVMVFTLPIYIDLSFYGGKSNLFLDRKIIIWFLPCQMILMLHLIVFDPPITMLNSLVHGIILPPFYWARKNITRNAKKG